jgi:hypothetical protein
MAGRWGFRWSPKCPAIILNNSGSMMASGRVQKSMDIIRAILRRDEAGSADYYVNDARTGIPDFITHLGGEAHGEYSNPLIPIMTGEDYMNTLALAAVIQEYPMGVYLIDDGDSITAWVSEALSMLAEMGSPAYQTPIGIFIVRGPGERAAVDRMNESLKRMIPKSEGFNVSVIHAIPLQVDHRTSFPDRTLS